MQMKYKGYIVRIESLDEILTGIVYFEGDKKTKICGSDKSEFQRCFHHAVNSYLNNNKKKRRDQHDGSRNN